MRTRTRYSLLTLALALALSSSVEAKREEQPIEHVGSELMIDPIVSAVGGWIFPMPWEAASAQPSAQSGLALVSMTPVQSNPIPSMGYVQPPPTPGLSGNGAIAAGALGNALGNAMVIASMEKARQSQMKPVTLAGGGEPALLALAKGVREEAAERGLALEKTVWGTVPGRLATKEAFRITDASHVFAISRIHRPMAGLSLDNQRLMVIAHVAVYERGDAATPALAEADMAYIGDPAPDGKGIAYWSGANGEPLKAQFELAGRQLAGALLDRTPNFVRAGTAPDARRGESLATVSRDGTHAHMLTSGNVVLVLPVHASVPATPTTPAAPAVTESGPIGAAPSTSN